MEVVIVVRMAPDYSTMSKESFVSQLRETFIPRTELKAVVENSLLETWSRLFAMSFFEYRQQMACIANQTLQATGCLVIKGHERFRRWLRQKDEAIVVPVDDDDWFSPHLAEIRSLFDDGKTIACWRKTTYKNFNTCKIYDAPQQFRLGSNNWAARKSWLSTIGEDKAVEMIIRSHRHAETYVKEHVAESDIAISQGHWSLYNRHCGSLAFLTAMCRNHVLDELIEIAKRRPTPVEIPDHFRWAEQYIRQLSDLNLRLRRKLIV